MKEFNGHVTGLISEEELQNLANGVNGGEARVPTPIISLSVIETVSLVTEYICPSSPCTDTGYCQ